MGMTHTFTLRAASEKYLVLVKPIATMDFTIRLKAVRQNFSCGARHNFATIAVAIFSAQKSLSLFIFPRRVRF